MYISVKNANTRIYICWKKIGHFGHTPPHKSSIGEGS
nr:MAG TPA: hypothetical protein [Caudoviricetes sp.]